MLASDKCQLSGVALSTNASKHTPHEYYYDQLNFMQVQHKKLQYIPKSAVMRGAKSK